jgi:S-formylglutathione hydrolase FrmB
MLAFVLALALGQAAAAQRTTPNHLDRLNALLAGRVIDLTHNHGADNRRYSFILCQPRDLYVYLPPGYSKDKTYPLVLWLHGAFGDELPFLDQGQLQYLDAGIQSGCLPPMIVACPDGTFCGENSLGAEHSLFLNGRGGRFQDHLTCEVLPFLFASFSISPCREAHAVVGLSAGGAGALNLAIKYQEFIGAAATIAGAANLRYGTVQGDYLADFNPATYRWQTEYLPDQVVARYLGGLVSIRAARFIEPVFGSGPDVVLRVMRENPADLIFRCPPLATPILLAYGGQDQFNMDAQGASFAYFASSLGVPVQVLYDPDGDHTSAYFEPAQRQVYRWLARQLPSPES